MAAGNAKAGPSWLWRTSFATVMVVVVMGGGGGAEAAPSFVLKWSPHPQSDGLRAFEKIQDDRQKSDRGVRHIYVQGDAYRFDMQVIKDHQREDGDRQRSEVVGMAGLTILKGESWRIRHKMFIPKSLIIKASTTTVTVMELVSAVPVLTVSLRLTKRKKNTIDLTLAGASGSSTTLASAILSPLQEKWIESEITFCAVANGTVHWRLTDAATNSVIVGGDGFGELFQANDDPVRPKWGIYRSAIKDSTAHQVESFFMLIKDLQAWKQE